MVLDSRPFVHLQDSSRCDRVQGTTLTVTPTRLLISLLIEALTIVLVRRKSTLIIVGRERRLRIALKKISLKHLGLFRSLTSGKSLVRISPVTVILLSIKHGIILFNQLSTVNYAQSWKGNYLDILISIVRSDLLYNTGDRPSLPWFCIWPPWWVWWAPCPPPAPPPPPVRCVKIVRFWFEQGPSPLWMMSHLIRYIDFETATLFRVPDQPELD
jgi:hypothetical protein